MEQPGFQVPSYIEGITPYVPGKPIEEVERELGIKNSIKLASNENPLGPSPRAMEALRACLNGLHLYPDGSGYYMRCQVAEAHGFAPDEVMLGNGSCELLEILIRTRVAPGDRVIMAWPSFVIYAITTRSVNGELMRVPLTADERHDLPAMAAAVNDRTRIIFVANPNNPTGTLVTADEVDAFMERIPNEVTVVFDEAYREYIDRPEFPDTMKYVRQGRNVLVTRTFSKIHGLAGLRIGYGVAPRRLFDYMNKVRSPFNTSSLGQAAAMAAMTDRDHLARTVAMNEAGKRQLYAAFDRLGLAYVPTEANFILVDVGQDIMAAHDFMMRQGVILRPMKGYDRPTSFRATIGTEAENAAMIAALEKLIAR